MTIKLLKKDAATGIIQQTDVSTAGAGVKAGTILNAAFSGSSTKQASVVFATAFANANYAVSFGIVADQPTGFTPSTISKTETGFTVDMLTGSLNHLVALDWIAAPFGE
jgi:hypothetical protein